MKCLECGKPLTGKQTKFCCKYHKNKYNHKHRYNYKYSREYRSKSPRNFMMQLRSYYNRKRTLSIEFLENLYEKQEGLCAITGQRLTYEQNTGRCHTNISIDRIDSSKGYEEDNIQLVCHIVNRMKQELELQELKEWCRKILEYDQPKQQQSI